MKFDVSRFKKVKADDKETHLLHPAGHIIKLQHNTLKPEIKKVLDSIPNAEPHLAYGWDGNPDTLNQAPSEADRSPASAPKKPVEQTSQPAGDIFERIGKEEGVNPTILRIIGGQESSYDPNAVGRETKYGRAKGLMQLIGSTAKKYGVTDPFDPEQNVRGAAKYLKDIGVNDKTIPLESVLGEYHGGTGWASTDKFGKESKDYLQTLVPKLIEAQRQGKIDPEHTIYDPQFKNLHAIYRNAPKTPLVTTQAGNENIMQRVSGVASRQPESSIPNYMSQAPQTSQQLEEFPWSTSYGPGETAKYTGPQQPTNTLQSMSVPAAEYWNDKQAAPNIEAVKAGNYPQQPQPQLTPTQQLEQAQQYAQQPKPIEQEQPKPTYAQNILFPEAQAAERPEAPKERPDYMGYGAAMEETRAGYGEQQQAFQAAQKAYGEYAAQTAEAYKQQQAEYKALRDRSDAIYNQSIGEAQKAAQALAQRTDIDPNRWLHNNVSTTGQKVMTALGLMFSGIGAGLTGKDNMAMQWINDQIDRDIKSQQQNFQNKDTLFRAYSELFKDQSQALSMTKAISQMYYASLIEQQGALMNNAVSSATAQKNAGALRVDAAKTLQEMAQRKAMTDYSFGMMQQGAQGNPMQAIRGMEMTGIIPKERADKMYKDVQEYTQNVQHVQSLIDSFDRMAELETITKRAGAPIQSKQELDALEARTIPELVKALAGRYTEFEHFKERKAWPELMDNEETAQLKRKKLIESITKIFNMPAMKPNFPELEAYGIRLPRIVIKPARAAKPAGY